MHSNQASALSISFEVAVPGSRRARRTTCSATARVFHEITWSLLMYGVLVLFHLVLLLVMLERWEQRVWVEPGAVTTRLQTGLTVSASVAGTVSTPFRHCQCYTLMTRVVAVHTLIPHANPVPRASPRPPQPAVVDVVGRRYRDLARSRLHSERCAQAAHPPVTPPLPPLCTCCVSWVSCRGSPWPSSDVYTCLIEKPSNTRGFDHEEP